MVGDDMSTHRRPRKPATVTHYTAQQWEDRRQRRASRRPSATNREFLGELRLVGAVLAVVAVWIAVTANWGAVTGFLGL